jgi:hypothetical protein
MRSSVFWRPAFLWLGRTPVGLYMRESTHGFAAVETIHLLGLALLGGVVLLLSLGALQVAVAGQTPAATARGLLPVFLAALSAMVVSGVLLVASKPMRYYLSPPFRWKLAFLAAGVALYLALDRRLTRAPEPRTGFTDRALAVALLVTWLGVGLAGRFIGLL